jgi:hypothetical protein
MMTKTRFPTVRLEDLKKILPEQVVDGNQNHRGNEKDKTKNKPQLAKTSKPKANA